MGGWVGGWGGGGGGSTNYRGALEIGVGLYV